MAGGGRPTRGPSLAERTDARRAQEGGEDQSPARSWPRHCWVHPTDGAPHLPGLLLEWRRESGQWLGRVAVGTLDENGRPQLVERWIDAGQLERR